mmetsp:Transcript_22224/g.56068  ORF Transcript_22224/g.56068 Transcript_22224/m.56068 type:complete len:279 (+) Transcript_22224:288-1124(+)|eukprot:CAMPEP_0178994544 /NCGR_PEP_ID=MMETSP0795-20121207/7329_1 /TAXON_ID=88552 /ORGANISM="Amoebophrya sp., Strain Ameob2" /LENGTH=278 /DNA_ID=CAMNT_0020686749 /DNA_START=284 /DNA_END=1120 /DNA_ORIENTATION=+
MADSQAGVLSRVIAAAGQGAVGAFVGAILSALSEPIVNRVLVKRIPLQQAMEEVTFEIITKFFQTTLPTNFVKFPFFEAVNVIMSMIDVSPAFRGTVTGAVFTTSTLPITNYRYRKSMGLPIEFGSLYQAYLPTVLRDIMYGIVRNNITTLLLAKNPEFARTNSGRFVNMFVTVFSACVLSAPGNEYRGYCLQPKGREKPFREFFQPVNFARSTIIGSTIMSTALACGALVTPQVTAFVDRLKAYLDSNPLSYCIIALYIAHRALEKYEKKNAAKAKS